MSTSEGSDERLRVVLDQESCVGGGQCEMLEAEMFVVDDDEGIASLTGDGWLPAARARRVVDRCPGQAITIAED